MNTSRLLLITAITLNFFLNAGNPSNEPAPEKPFSIAAFVKKNTANRKAYEQKQRDFLQKARLKSEEAAKAVVKNFNEKYGKEMTRLLAAHHDITETIKSEQIRSYSQKTEEEIATFLATFSSGKKSSGKNILLPKNPPSNEPIFKQVPQPQGVPITYTPEQPDDLRYLYCLNEVCFMMPQNDAKEELLPRY